MTPRNQEKVFKKSHAKVLLGIAKDDLASANILFASSEKVRAENIAFLCQQAIEKSLKAVLVHLEVPVPQVHDAGILVAKMPDGFTPPAGYDLSELTSFATVRRYEEGSSPLTRKELEAIVSLAKRVLQWVELQIQK